MTYVGFFFVDGKGGVRRDPIADQALASIDRERGRGEVAMVRLACRYKRANGAACMYTVQTDESNADFGERLMENHIDQLHPDRQLAPETQEVKS